MQSYEFDLMICRKSFDIPLVNEVVLEIANNLKSRSENHSNEEHDLHDADGSIPIMEMSDSDMEEDEVHEENDGSSLGM